MPATSTLLDRGRDIARVDLPANRTPSGPALALATVLAIAGSLVADTVLVAIAKLVFPATSGYQHYRFSDYAALTVIGVLIACAAWPIVTRLTSHARWMFSRMAVLVTAVLLLPDVALLVRGDSAQAVAVLVGMHLVIGLITYQVLVRVAAPTASGRDRVAQVEGDGREVAARRG